MGEPLDDDRLATARAWCDKARQLIGYGLVGQSKQMYHANVAVETGLKELQALASPEYARLLTEYERLAELAKTAEASKDDPGVRKLIDQIGLLEAEINAAKAPGPAERLVAQKVLHAQLKARAQKLLDALDPKRKDLASQLAKVAPASDDNAGYEDANKRLSALLLTIERAEVGAAGAHVQFDLAAKALTQQLLDAQPHITSADHDGMDQKIKALIELEAAQHDATNIQARTTEAAPLKLAIELAVADGKERTKKKNELLADRLKLAAPPGASASEAEALKTARDELLPLLDGVPTTVKLEEAANKLKQARTLAKSTQLLATARTAFQKRETEITAILKAADAVIDGSSRSLLLLRLKTAHDAVDGATEASKFNTQLAELEKLPAALSAAKNFNVARDELQRAALGYIKLEGVGNEVALKSARDIALQAAAVEAGMGDWAAATAKLAGFRATLVGPAAGKLDAIDAYTKRLASFDAQDLPRLREVKAEAAVPGYNQLDNELADARKKGAPGKDYAGAVVKLDELAAKLTQMQAYATLRRQVVSLKQVADIYKPPDKAKIDAAVVLGDQKATAKDWVAAEGAMTTLLGTKAVFTQGAGLAKARAAVKASYELLQLTYAATPVGLALKTLWDSAANKEAQKKYDEATASINTLSTRLAPATTYLETVAALGRRLDVNHGGVKAALLKPAADLAVPAAKFVEASAALADLARLIDALDAYDARREQVQTLRGAVPATDKAQQEALDEVLKKSAATAKTATEGSATAAAARFDTARSELDEVALRPEFEATNTALLDYRSHLAQVSKVHSQVHGRMTPPQAKTALADALAAATNPAETAQNWAESAKLLTAHGALLVEARCFIDKRESALAMQRQLDNIATKYPAHSVAIYTPHSALDIINRLATANADAVAARFKDGAAKYETLITDCRAMCLTAAKKLDGETFGRGHSVARHGPEVTPAQLIHRLNTGLAPDGKECKAESASQFDFVESWLETRDKAVEQAKVNSAGKYNPSATEVPYTDPLEYIEDIEHPKPIDTSALGLKEKPALDATKGKFEGDGTYESHIIVKGLTRTRSIFRFQLLDPAQLFPAGTKAATTHRKAEDWKSAHDGQTYGAKTINKFVGEWILLTQYPLTVGWDPETNSYTIPL